ncbi:transposase [Candidatus Uhrbacteria bacterium]|nr:transposase [Candidatus Uhrbacteria bacterium]
MGRAHRINVGGIVYHVINRANARMQIFDTPRDYQLFEEILEQAKERIHVSIFSYCIMPNHWHLVLEPQKDGDLSKFMHWLTLTHTQRWHAQKNSIGSGHIYQGRYKAFPVQTDEYFLWVCRYVERNPIRAGLVRNVDDWNWGSVWQREHGTTRQRKLLDAWTTQPPRDYLKWLKEPEEDNVLKKIRSSVNRGQPFGDEEWSDAMIKAFNIQSTVTPRGRPKKVVV